jgi:hypothetical protein
MPPNQMAQAMEMEGFVQSRMNPIQGAPPANPAEGRHALQDYQMQLMLLEQQNKKRLLQARREQDTINQAGASGNSAMFAPNMSPSGSRGAGPSPNSAELRRVGGPPKVGQHGLPGSPMNEMHRNSPGAPNMDPANGQIQQGMTFYAGNMGPGAMGRPPSSHPGFPPTPGSNPQQFEAMRLAQNRTALANGGQPWPAAGQGPPNAGGQQQAGLGGPQRPGNMPPPPAPVETSVPASRPQESSPVQSAAPPTPSQTAKAGPKKKEPASKKKNQPKKGGSAAAAAAAAATPAATEPEPPTPTPSTPLPSSMHRDSITTGGAQQPALGNNNGPAPAPAPATSQSQGSQPMLDSNPGAPLFGATGTMDDVSFATVDSLGGSR